MGTSVLTKLMMLERQIKVVQEEKDRLSTELIDARLEIVDLEERLIDLSYVATELHAITEEIDIQTTEKERIDLIKQSMDKLATDNELLIKENKELKNDLTYINLRLDKNIKTISKGEVVVPQKTDEINHYGYDATKLANDDSSTTVGINPDQVPTSSHVGVATQHFRKRTNKYSNPLGHKHQASESWIVPASKNEPVVHAAHYLVKKSHPDYTTANKKPLDMTSRYRRHNDKHPKNKSRQEEVEKSRISITQQTPRGRIPVRPSIDLTPRTPPADNQYLRKQSTTSNASHASSTTLGRVSPKTNPKDPNPRKNSHK
ncbi:MAG: hypothetical protein [Sclerotinia sclerotiorum negative-stranded RNA virus 10]|uniref:Uncharacterized protein n=1 Tax=Sclerotinia sclerotiorum negative-stranded RNA virus 10 TaxID=2822963 RepID=A0AA45L1C8_9MONO|nr:MAG: hypothetical protein [Sclerotinia sclerotiorum negative-stranded RNA virus 10]